MKERPFIKLNLMLLKSYVTLLWTGMERPQNIIIGSENNNVAEQTHDASKLDMMNVTKIGSEYYPEDRINFNYGNKKYNEAFNS